MTSNITGVTFEFRDMHLHGSAFCEFLALRKRFFVDTLAWNIPHDDRLEMDQYDNPTASYSLVRKDGRIVGGARIMRFADRWGPHGCMLRDAGEGKLVDIPAATLPMDRSFTTASECTRLVICDSLRTGQDRERALGLVVDGLVDLALKSGSDELVTLTVPSFVRTLKRLGYDAGQIGQRYRNAQDGRSYAVLGMPARRRGSAGLPLEVDPPRLREG